MPGIAKNDRIFITGATGLLGSFIVRVLFAHGFRNITALRRPDSATSLVSDVADHVHWVEGDVREVSSLEEGMRRADYVVHCAALISYDRRRYREMHAINVEGTANAVNVALECGVQRFVHISSIATSTRTGGEQHIDETTEWHRTRYNTEYGLTKHLAEMEVYRGQAEGLNVLILTPSVVLGGGRWDSGSSLMFRKVWDGVRVYPTGTTGFVDARDVGRFIVHDLVNKLEHTVYMLNCENRRYVDILRQIAQLLGKRPPAFRLKPWMSEVGWRLLAPVSRLTGKHALLTRDMSRTTQCDLHFDHRLSLRVPGFAYIPLDDTLQDICKYFEESVEKNFQLPPMPLQR